MVSLILMNFAILVATAKRYKTMNVVWQAKTTVTKMLVVSNVAMMNSVVFALLTSATKVPIQSDAQVVFVFPSSLNATIQPLMTVTPLIEPFVLIPMKDIFAVAVKVSLIFPLIFKANLDVCAKDVSLLPLFF